MTNSALAQTAHPDLHSQKICDGHPIVCGAGGNKGRARAAGHTFLEAWA